MRLALRRWVWAPVRHTPLQHRRRWLLAPRMARADPVVRADLAREDRLVPRTAARADPAVQADPETTALMGPVVQADPGTTARVTPADPGTSTRADPVAQADLPRADHGAEIPSVAISTGPRGATEQRPGDGARRRGRLGTDRSRRPAGSGGMAQSTTGATRKRPCGIPVSTSGVSGSSGSGSRCKKPHHTAPAGRLARRAPCDTDPSQADPAIQRPAAPAAAVRRIRPLLSSPLAAGKLN